MPIAARAKLATRLIVLAAAGMAVVGLSACDATVEVGAVDHPDGPDADTRQVTVVGTGEVQGTPDTLTVNASIEFTAPDATAAMNQASDASAGRDRRAGRLGHRPKADISTTNVTLQPQFGGGDTPSIIAYQANNSINVKIRRLDSASADAWRDRHHGR